MVAYPNAIDDHASRAVAICPNPATDHFYLEVDDQVIDKLEIFTTTGQLVHSQRHIPGGESIGVSFLSSGVYFVRYETAGRVGTQKLIVK